MVASLTAVAWAAPTRMIRDRLRTLEGQEFVAAAEALGETRWQILRRELLPFARPYVLAIFLLRVPATILSESTVSFLGFGLPPDKPSLGSFIGNNYMQIVEDAGVVAPAWILLVLIVVAFQWTGQALADGAEVRR
jgi:ABC-type dipeptide/oligopeptide/nickel transport system permease subunit